MVQPVARQDGRHRAGSDRQWWHSAPPLSSPPEHKQHTVQQLYFLTWIHTSTSTRVISCTFWPVHRHTCYQLYCLTCTHKHTCHQLHFLTSTQAHVTLVLLSDLYVHKHTCLQSTFWLMPSRQKVFFRPLKSRSKKRSYEPSSPDLKVDIIGQGLHRAGQLTWEPVARQA